MIKKKKTGFTLIEMIIVVALITVVLTIIIAIFFTGNKVFSDTNIKSTLQMDAQTIQEQLSKKAIQGYSIERIVKKDSSGSNADGQTDIKEIVINSYDDGDTMNQNQYEFIFSEEDHKLTMKNKSGSERILSSNVNAFKIKLDNDKSKSSDSKESKSANADKKSDTNNNKSEIDKNILDACNGVQFQIDLGTKQVYSIKVGVTFRNKNTIKITSQGSAA